MASMGLLRTPKVSATATLAHSRRTSRPARIVCQSQAKASFGQTAAALLAATSLLAGSASALTYDELQGMTYREVKGSGIANTCPIIESGSSDVKGAVKAGNYKMENFCIEPTSFKVKSGTGLKSEGGDTSGFSKTSLITRLTYTLDAMTAKFMDGSGNVALKEEDGIDYAAMTVQLPGVERVPFLFSVKQLDAKGTLDKFAGDFTVPNYRGSSFQDPKGRGGSMGYDYAIGLPAKADAEELLRENVKQAKSSKGYAVMSVARADPTTGEVAGVFESIQPTDDDMGAKTPKEVKVTALWYGRLSAA